MTSTVNISRWVTGRREPRRLHVRFRTAAVLLLLPLLGLAAVSGANVMASTSAAAELNRAQQQLGRLHGVHEAIQRVAIDGTSSLASHQPAEIAAMRNDQTAVDADLGGLSQIKGLAANQSAALQATIRAWKDSFGVRASVLAAGPQSSQAVVIELEDGLTETLKGVVKQLGVLEGINTANVVALHQRLASAFQASTIAIVVSLLIGIAGALLVSRRLARSILAPLARLREASEQLASGQLDHRIAVGGSDELADVGTAFNVMADQLSERQEAVRHREQRLSALVENASDGILVIAADGRLVFVTPSFEADFAGESAEGAHLLDIVHPDDTDRARKAWLRVATGGDGSTSEVEVRLRRKDGLWRHVWVKLTNRLNDPAVAGMVLNLSDVSERHDYEQQLSHQALHDALTGLPNRELFRRRLERAMVDGISRNATHSVLYLDFDDFKRINDSRSHRIGDDFLVAMAARLTSCVRPEDTVARLGGDEFAVLLDSADSGEAVAATLRVLTALATPWAAEGKDIVPSASIGIASAVAGGIGPETLLGDADLAMYFAKRQGKGRYEVFAAAMRSDLLDRLQLGEDLRVAIESEALSLQYQPIVNTQTGIIVGAEALARWEHPTRGWVGPAIFIPLAEEIGVVDRIDCWILRQACVQGRAWADAGMPPLRIAVNLSGRDLDKDDLVEVVATTLSDTGYEPGNLELELTEGVAIAESHGARLTLVKLKELGVHLAIDDFGTGYSALGRLRELPFDRLKVDKTFVDELSATHDGSTLVDSILDMARVLGLEVVAEGVETADQADFLRTRHCDFAQGYLFSRPVDASTFATLLADGGSLTPETLSAAAAAS
jgi:diguanylate cyclase (GGDEF)-like protein/PAS domain S-box-containing protein